MHLCGFSPLKVSMCRIMWLQISCICLYSLQCVFCCDISWATVPVEKLHWVHLWVLGIEEEENRVRMTIFGSKIGFIHCIGNSLGEETTKVLCQRMSGDLFNEIVFLSDVIWSRDCKYPVKKNYHISIILKLVQFEPWYGSIVTEIYSWINIPLLHWHRTMTLLHILHSLYWSTGAPGPGIWKNGAKMAMYV